ncbi:MAG: cupin domain-containing protein [Candidatus Syntrophosphaera sp.]|nr:cupin domain-containing protein [Candidatus Syntrophosphaera sp.]
MKIIHFDQAKLEPVNAEGAAGTKIRWLVAQKDGAPNFALRMFEVEPQGHTPFHIHDWEHEVYVLEGTGVLQTERGDLPFAAHDAIYVDPGLKHAFKNTGTGIMKFLCIIPHEQPQPKKTVNPFAEETANNC